MLPALIPRDRLQIALALVLVAAVASVALLPAARGESALLGALPFWLIGLPLASLLGLGLLRGLAPAVSPARLRKPRRPRPPAMLWRGARRPLPQRFGQRRPA